MSSLDGSVSAASGRPVTVPMTRDVGQRARSQRRGLRALVAGLCLAAGALLVGPVANGSPGQVGLIELLALAGLFLVTELVTFNVQFRREAHAFTFTELPLVIGLHLVGGVGLVLAQLLGAFVARTLWRPQRRIKRAFNLALGAFDAAVAVLVFTAARGGSSALGPRGQASTLLATVVVSVTSAVLIAAAIQLAGGGYRIRSVVRTIGLSIVVTATNTALALVAVLLLRDNPASAWLLVAPCATIYFAYRAFTRERREHERLDFLYSCSRDLHEGADAEEAVTALLTRTVESFRASTAELVVFPASERAAPLRTAVGTDGASEVMVPLPAEDLHVLAASMVAAPHARLLTLDTALSLRPYLIGRRVEAAMVAPLQIEDRTVGFLLVGNPLGEVNPFAEEDLPLLGALAGQIRVFLEFDRLCQAFERLSNLQGQLVHQAYHDPLTSLGNRALFIERVEKALEGGRPVAVLFIDLDDFKTINDSLGHEAGDLLLSAVARRLEGCMRSGELSNQPGGEEFAILIEQLVTPGDELALADRVLDALTAPFSVLGQQLLVRASVGVAVSDSTGGKVGDLLRRADVAMYSAKHGGKGQAAEFEHRMDVDLQDRLDIEADLAKAVAAGDLDVAYQPIVDLVSGRTVAIEALVRWQHAVRGLVPATTIVEVAERCGLVVDLGRSVLERSCARWAGLRTEGAGITLAVNVSVRELQAPGFVDEVLATVRRHGLSPEGIILEVTETLLVDAGAAGAKLQALRSAGIRVAVDDFGTGYSSLSYLRSLPLDLLKINKSFVAGLRHLPDGAEDPLATSSQEGAQDRAVTAAIIGLARTLGLGVVAEGIESAEQLAELRALGCELGQGFYLGPPVEASELGRLLQDSMPAPVG
ncbi:hypothetical protein BH18ACT1_BH18ACT1_12750 [soil metagenome]